MASNFPGFLLTTRRSLRERGIRSRRTATKEHLKIDRIVDSLAYATIRQDFDWRNVIYSDEVVVSNDNYEEAMDVHLFHNLVYSMLCRMSAIVNAGRLWTKY